MAAYYDLGDPHAPVTTTSAEAQTWFDRGLVWSLRVQPRGGGALLRARGRGRPRLRDGALGHRLRRSAPTTTRPGTPSTRQDLADAVARHATPPSRRALGAGRPGHAGRAGADRRAAGAATRRPTPAEDCTVWNDAYADAMRDVYARVPRRPRRRGAVRRGADEPHAVAAVGPRHRRSRPRAPTPPRRSTVLERAHRAARGARHPGLLHLYVHAMEMSPYPERALQAARPAARPRPRRRPPACTWRPTSTCSAATTATSWSANERGDRGRPQVPRAGGRAQLLHPLPRATTTTSRSTARCSSASSSRRWRRRDELAATLPEALLREPPPMADWLEGFVPMRAARAGPVRPLATS